MDVFVEIVSYETGAVEKRLGPFNERKADRIDDGVNRNLDHENFYSRIVADDAKPEGTPQ